MVKIIEFDLQRGYILYYDRSKVSEAAFILFIF